AALVLRLALPEAARREEAHLGAPAAGAGDVALGPAEIGEEGEAAVGVLEKADGLDQRVRGGLGSGAVHAPESSTPGLLSQVYYRTTGGRSRDDRLPSSAASTRRVA